MFAVIVGSATVVAHLNICLRIEIQKVELGCDHVVI